MLLLEVVVVVGKETRSGETIDVVARISVVEVLSVVVVIVRNRNQSLKSLGNLSRDASEHEESLEFLRLGVVILLEAVLDLRVGKRRRERDEADVVCDFVDGDEGALVQALDDDRDVLERRDVDPRAALARAGRGVGVRLDEDDRAAREMRLHKHLHHLGQNVAGSFFAELANEDAEGGLIAMARASHAVVAEGVGAAVGALPRDLTFQRLVGAAGVELDGGDVGVDGNEGRDVVLLEELDGLVLLADGDEVVVRVVRIVVVVGGRRRKGSGCCGSAFVLLRHRASIFCDEGGLVLHAVFTRDEGEGSGEFSAVAVTTTGSTSCWGLHDFFIIFFLFDFLFLFF